MQYTDSVSLITPLSSAACCPPSLIVTAVPLAHCYMHYTLASRNFACYTRRLQRNPSVNVRVSSLILSVNSKRPHTEPFTKSLCSYMWHMCVRERRLKENRGRKGREGVWEGRPKKDGCKRSEEVLRVQPREMKCEIAQRSQVNKPSGSKGSKKKIDLKGLFT